MATAAAGSLAQPAFLDAGLLSLQDLPEGRHCDPSFRGRWHGKGCFLPLTQLGRGWLENLDSREGRFSLPVWHILELPGNQVFTRNRLDHTRLWTYLWWTVFVINRGDPAHCRHHHFLGQKLNCVRGAKASNLPVFLSLCSWLWMWLAAFASYCAFPAMMDCNQVTDFAR